MLERGSSLLVVTLLVVLAGCGKSGPDSSGNANAATNPAAKDLKFSEASRKFLVIEPVGGIEPTGGRTYFGRVAFRPKALSAVTGNAHPEGITSAGRAELLDAFADAAGVPVAAVESPVINSVGSAGLMLDKFELVNGSESRGELYAGPRASPRAAGWEAGCG